MPSASLPPAALPAPISRTELLWLAGLTFVALVLRVSGITTVAIEHFDEAVYAANVLFPPEAGAQYPHREFFAPYLWPLLLELMSLLSLSTTGNVNTLVLFLPGLLFGVGTVPLVWWVARPFAGSRVALAATALAACDGFQAAYSRTALTDVPAMFLILAAVGCWIRATTSSRWQWTTAAGGLTGLAWSVKYQGWWPLAVAGGSVVLGACWERSFRGLVRTLIPRWLVMGLVAGIVAIPMFVDLQDIGGYFAVSAHHRGYFTGWSAWPAQAILQLSNLWFYERTTFLAGLLLAVACGFTPSMPTTDLSASRSGWLAMLAWFGGALVAIPLYTAYPRLVLLVPPPLWFLFAAALCRLTRQPRVQDAAQTSRLSTTFVSVAVLLLTGTLWAGTSPGGLRESRLSAWQTARWVESQLVAQRDHAVVFALQEPAIFYQLSVAGRIPTVLAVSADIPPVPDRQIYLVTGQQAAADPELRRTLQSGTTWESVGTFPVLPSSIVRRDHGPPLTGPVQYQLWRRR